MYNNAGKGPEKSSVFKPSWVSVLDDLFDLFFSYSILYLLVVDEKNQEKSIYCPTRSLIMFLQ
jgi:hypothetical protein